MIYIMHGMIPFGLIFATFARKVEYLLKIFLMTLFIRLQERSFGSQLLTHLISLLFLGGRGAGSIQFFGNPQTRTRGYRHDRWIAFSPIFIKARFGLIFYSA